MAKKSSRFIGQSVEANLLWEISQKLDRLIQVTAAGIVFTTSTTTTLTTTTSTTSTTTTLTPP